MIGPLRADRLRLLLTPALVVAGIAVCWGVFFTLMGQDTDPFILNQAFVQDRFIRHLQLVGLAFTMAALIGVPLGVLMARSGRALRIPVLVVANLGQALPSIGVLVLFYAILGGLGVKPTVVALVLYALLPILRNTMVGIQGVDPAVVEAGRGTGMTGLQALLRIQLPLASPVIFAGLRTALVLIVGTATLGNFVGGGGLGDVIDAGLTQNPRVVFVGAVLVADLALLADWGLGLVERVLTPRM